jgi:RNA polymerase sigma factor (sigma-70 family)
MDIENEVNTFVVNFMTKHNSLINSVGRKYLIPNRYTIDDIKQYISERVIQILTNRLSTADNKIEDPEKYFKSCITYYCIEYQRMHGYTFELPKRPRKNCELDEQHIRSYGFKYLDDMNTAEFNSLIVEDKEVDTSTSDLVWSYLTSILSKDESNVLVCIFKQNMTWSETSKHLNVPQSTCWIRKDRAIDKISKRFSTIDGKINEQLKKFLRGDPGILSDFNEDK